MAGERVMWLVWHPISGISYVDDNELDAIALACDENEAMWDSLRLCGWRCDQITVKETDDERG
jgi:hypothetical protein